MKHLAALQRDPQWSDWRWQLDHAVESVEELAACLGVSPARWHDLGSVAERFPLRTTPYYLSLAQSPDRADPVLAQVLPDPRELSCRTAGDPDPLAEQRDSPVPGLVHRYPDRVLLITTSACAVHCRHCMRKRGWDVCRRTEEQAQRDRVLAYLGDHPEVHEVIVSGGDPLLLAEEDLDRLLADLHAIPHVELVRIGSRLPVVLPQRLTASFCRTLGRHGPVWLATHANHPNELTAASAQAVRNLLAQGIPVVNQTVLLKGVNDDAAILAELFRGLLRQRIKPYYLFHGDPVAGTEHFRTGLDRALHIVDALRESLSGLAQPAFAFDLPGGGGKIRLEPTREGEPAPDGTRRFRDFRGAMRSYPDPRPRA